jgi:RluA family pseudouridine synthase
MPVQPFAMEDLTVLFEDDDLIVINKPPRLRVIPDGYNGEIPSIKSILDAHYGKVFIVHRLDKDTSGLLILAKNAKSHKILNTQFQNRKIHKVYHAILISLTPIPLQMDIDVPLRVNGDRSHRTVVDPVRGKAAETHFELLTCYGQVSLVKAEPRTGYTHQIRAHALYAGFPLLGDSLYSFHSAGSEISTNLPAFPHPALHACQLSLAHPSTADMLEFTCPDPPDFVEFLAHQNKDAEG